MKTTTPLILLLAVFAMLFATSAQVVTFSAWIASCSLTGDADPDGEWIRFDFGTSKIIDEAKFYQSSAATHGTWKVQGSPDASSWTDVGTSFTFGGSTLQTITELSGTTSTTLTLQPSTVLVL